MITEQAKDLELLGCVGQQYSPTQMESTSPVPPRQWFSFARIGLISSLHYVLVVTDELLR